MPPKASTSVCAPCLAVPCAVPCRVPCRVPCLSVPRSAPPFPFPRASARLPRPGPRPPSAQAPSESSGQLGSSKSTRPAQALQQPAAESKLQQAPPPSPTSAASTHARLNLPVWPAVTGGGAEPIPPAVDQGSVGTSCAQPLKPAGACLLETLLADPLPARTGAARGSEDWLVELLEAGAGQEEAGQLAASGGEWHRAQTGLLAGSGGASCLGRCGWADLLSGPCGDGAVGGLAAGGWAAVATHVQQPRAQTLQAGWSTPVETPFSSEGQPYVGYSLLGPEDGSKWQGPQVSLLYGSTGVAAAVSLPNPEWAPTTPAPAAPSRPMPPIQSAATAAAAAATTVFGCGGGQAGGAIQQVLLHAS
jgi:hypothetical protein